MSIPAKDWNNQLKQFTSGLAGLIPEVGGIVKFLLSTFWPTSYDDIWKLLKEKITELIHQIVDQEILKHELAERKAQLKGFYDSLQQYVKAQNHEKGELLAAMLVNANTFFEELDQSLNDIHFLPIAIVLAYLHLSLLRERLLYGKELYTEDNTPIWRQGLEEYMKKYQKTFLTKFQKWKSWRYHQFDLLYYEKQPVPNSPPDTYCDITDKLSGKTWHYCEPKSKPESPRFGVDMLRQRVMSEIIPEMIQLVYNPSFQLGQFIPGHEKNAPVADESVGRVTLGHFKCATGDDRHSFCDYSTFIGTPYISLDLPGEIVQIDVREHNFIDGMQIHYEDHDGTFVGNPSGGSLHTFKVTKGAVVNYVYMGFSQGLLTSVQFKFSDGTDTGMLGNRSHWSLRYEVKIKSEKLLGDDFALRNIIMQPGRGPSDTVGVANVMLIFYHKSLF